MNFNGNYSNIVSDGNQLLCKNAHECDDAWCLASTHSCTFLYDHWFPSLTVHHGIVTFHDTFDAGKFSKKYV